MVSQVCPFVPSFCLQETCYVPLTVQKAMTLLPIPSHVSRRLCLFSCSVFWRNAFLASALPAHGLAISVHDLANCLFKRSTVSLSSILLSNTIKTSGSALESVLASVSNPLATRLQAWSHHTPQNHTSSSAQN